MKRRKRFLKNRAHGGSPAPKRKKTAKAAGKTIRTDVKSTTIVRKNPRFDPREYALAKGWDFYQIEATAKRGCSEYEKENLSAADCRALVSWCKGQLKAKRKNPRKRRKARRIVRHVKRKVAAVKRRPPRRKSRPTSKCSYLAVRQGSKIMLARVQNSKAKRLGTFSMGGLKKYCAKHGIKM